MPRRRKRQRRAHRCALLEAGTLRCWGANNFGQLGNGAFMASRTPIAVPMLGDVQEIAIGGDTTCAVDRKGALSCWGANTHGQLGDGTHMARALPTGVTLAEPVAHVAVGEQAICALTATGAVYCIGAPYGDPDDAARPILMDLRVPVATIISGGRFVCAAESADAPCVWCWGDDETEQLADGAFQARRARVAPRLPCP